MPSFLPLRFAQLHRVAALLATTVAVQAATVEPTTAGVHNVATQANTAAAEQKPRIAVFSGPTATIQNSRPLVTSNKARRAAGLPLLKGRDNQPITFDELYPQRLAAPVTVYIEQFTAHPLEQDVAELYAPADGYIQADGRFAKERRASTDKPVYAVTLEPGDGLYPLPFMGRQADGSSWDS